jgi:hypothetical protein
MKREFRGQRQVNHGGQAVPVKFADRLQPGSQAFVNSQADVQALGAGRRM